MTKLELLNKLNSLQSGLPTDLVYINRVIHDQYVQVPPLYQVNTIDEFIIKDIQSIASLNISIIRPILGMFGSGKSTILNRIEQLLPSIIPPDQYFVIKINLQNVPILQHEEFIEILMKKVFPILEKPHFKEIFENTEERELIDVFKGVEIVKKIKKLYSRSEMDNTEAKEFFYDQIKEERIFQVIDGVITLAKMNNKIVIVLIDELEYLINLDKDRIITEIIVSRIIRGIMERYNNSVYIAFTCYKEAYEQLRENFYRFYRVVENQEIKLGDLSESEKEELIQKLLDESMEFTFGKLNARELLNKFRSRIDFYMGNAVKLIALEVFQCIDQLKEIWTQTCRIYENNARQSVAIPKLSEWGFRRENIGNDTTILGGYSFDIFASESNRNTISKRAFGEIKSVKCHKHWAEEFINWIKNLDYSRSGDYVKERDYLLFIAPDYTTESYDLLQNYNIFCLKYSDPMVERLIAEIEDDAFKDLTEEEKKIVGFINETKSKSRSYNVVIKKYPDIHTLEELARKEKIKIKMRKDKKYIHLIT